MHVSRGALFYALYRSLFYPIARGLFSALAFANPKIRRGLELRKTRPWRIALPTDAAERPTFWFHCASGEFEYAKPIITRLKREFPESRVCVTYFSPTFAKVVANFPGVDQALPLPWDTPKDLSDFIQFQKPSCLLIARTDTWPELLRQTRRNQIPTLLFSAMLSSKSSRLKNPLVRWMTKSVFQYLDAIFCVDDDDLRSFQQLGLSDRTHVAGDTRYDQVLARLENPKPIRDDLFATHPRDRVIVCGSTWPEDERVLLEAARVNPEWSFVLVPHEPTEDHLAKLESEARLLGLQTVRYSRGDVWPENTLLLVDKIGILAELYQTGSVAFVGGSFRKTVHSVMEPLASGALTLVGPLHSNNREAIEFSKLAEGSHYLVMPVGDAQAIKSVLRKAENLGAVSERIRREIKRRAGKSDLVKEWAESRIATTKADSHPEPAPE